jgi:hypothetical protein
MRLHRRQLLRALGLGALVGPRWAVAQQREFPTRVVFFVQPHGHVPSSWQMSTGGARLTAFSEHPLGKLAEPELSEVLRPLFPWRDKVLAIDGLAHTAALESIAYTVGRGGDVNNHNVAVASLLTGARVAQHSGSPCTGGAISIDQLLGQRTVAGGRFASRVYGGDYVPNQTVAPFSFLGPSQATPLVKDPADAFTDLVGAQTPIDPRQSTLQRLRPSVLDSVSEEYRLVASRLDRQGRERLEGHRALVRDLELRLAQPEHACVASFDGSDHKTLQFMRLMRMAFTCDLTRVMTYAAPVPACPEFDYPANADVHATYAHASVPGAASCGQMYSPAAERAMTDLSVWYGRQVAFLVNELASVPEGNGTLLDNTVVVWLTELGTPTHQHHRAFTVLIGGAQGYFKTGRYLRYPDLYDNPVPGNPADWPRVGPAHNKLFISLLNALGQPDTSFGTTEATSLSGELISLTGPLNELRS